MRDTIKFKKLQIQSEPSAQGAFSHVFKARYNHVVVCVKRIKPKQANDTAAIHREITLLKKSQQHENVVKLIGHCESDKTYYIVTEWIDGGNLRQYLKDYLIKLSWLDRIEIAKGIALGIQHLHDKGIIHRDIKSRNILIERKKNQPKLCDFGFAAEYTDPDISNTTCGTGEWMAPELYNKTGTCTFKADTFSYGIVLVELITRKNIARELPRNAASDFGIDIDLLKQHTPADCPIEFLDLAISCCHFDPELRTVWPEVIRILDSIASTLPPNDNHEEDSEEDFHTGIASDDDVVDDVYENDYSSASSASSASSSPSPSPSIMPRYSPQPPYFITLPQHIGTPQPSPTSSPTASPSLSRPRKTTTLRFALTHNRCGNASDSGSASSSNGSKTINASNRASVFLPTPLPAHPSPTSSSSHSPLPSSHTSPVPPLPITSPLASPHSPLASPLSSHSPTSSPPSSPGSTPRPHRRPPPPPIIVHFPNNSKFVETANNERRSPSASASALELTTPLQEIGPGPTLGPAHVPLPAKPNSYAKHLLRKLAPLRFVRSRSDPCINVHGYSDVRTGDASDTPQAIPMRSRHDTLRMSISRPRKRRDTDESKPKYEHKDEIKEKEEQKERIESPRSEEETEEEEETTEKPGTEKSNVTDLAINIRDDYEPEITVPSRTTTATSPPKQRRHKKIWKLFSGVKL